MPAEFCADGFLADVALFHGEGGVGEFGDHAVLGEEVEVAAGFFGAGFFGHFFGHGGEILFFRGDTLEGTCRGFFLFGHDIIRGVLGDEDQNVAGPHHFGVFEFLFVLVVELFDVVFRDGCFVADLPFHPFLLLHHFFDAVAEGGFGFTGFGHFGLEDILAGKLAFDPCEFLFEVGVFDFHRGRFARDEFVDDEFVENFAVSRHFLVGGEVVGIDPRGGEGAGESFLKVGAGDFFALDHGDRVGEFGGGGRFGFLCG